MSKRESRFSVGWMLVGVLLVAAVVVSTQALTTRSIADNATRLHWSNATIGAVATTRSAVVQAHVLLAGAALELVDPGAAGAALEEAKANRNTLVNWVALAPTEDSALTESLSAFGQEVDRAIASLGEGEPDLAADIIGGSLEEQWGAARVELEADQQEAVDRIRDSESLAGLLSLIMRVAIMLVIPVGAILIYRSRVKREFRRARSEHRLQLASEKRLRNEKDLLIAGIAHEVRTPLTSVFGFSEILSAHADNEVAELGSLIHRDAAELRRLTDDFLAAARLAEGSLGSSPSGIPVADIVDAEVDAATEPAIQTRVAPATVLFDRQHLGQILRNLMSNAITHGGNSIWISGELRSGTYHLAVSDNGAGIPAEKLDQALGPFSNRGEKALTAGSVGLGLHVVRGLARSGGGDLHYVHQDGWTHLIVTLPQAVVTPPDAVVAAALEAAG